MQTTTNTIKLNLKELNNYSLFNKQSALDESTWNYVEWLHDNDFPQSVVDVLLHLGSRSLRVLGISFPKQSTIAASTGISRQTVSTALKTLTNLGIIDSVRLLNKWRASGKVYRIKPFNLDSLHQHFTSVYGYGVNDTNTLTMINEFEPYPTETCSKDLKETYATQDVNDNQSIKIDRKDMTPYQQLKQFVSYFVNNSKVVYKVWGIWLAKTKQALKTNATGFKMDVDLLLRAIRVTMQSYKEGKTSNITGYFSGVLSNILAKENSAESDSALAAPIAHVTTGKQRTEQVPDWFKKKYDASQDEGIDFEAEQAKIWAKLGY